MNETVAVIVAAGHPLRSAASSAAWSDGRGKPCGHKAPKDESGPGIMPTSAVVLTPAVIAKRAWSAVRDTAKNSDEVKQAQTAAIHQRHENQTGEQFHEFVGMHL